MEIEIIEIIQKEKTIEVELPYYYKHDLSDDRDSTIIYGKIDLNIHTTIKEREDYSTGKREYEIERESHSSIKNSGLASYFKPEHKSQQLDHEEVKERALAFLRDLWDLIGVLIPFKSDFNDGSLLYGSF